MNVQKYGKLEKLINIPKYENILNGDVLEMIEVAKIIQANMKIQEKAKDKD